MQDLGIVESLLAPELGPDLVEIVTTMSLQLRSVLNVPAVSTLQSLWVSPFNLTEAPEGMYELDTKITHRGTTVITTNTDYAPFEEEIDTQTFMVDRSAPIADLSLAIGEGSGLYQNPDGSYVAAAHADDSTLTLIANPTGDSMDPGAYLYQIISLDAEGNPGVNVWNPATLTTDLALTYMGTHKVTLPIGGENSLIGHFGLRAVGIDSILNISSSTKPTMLKVVPLESDNADVTVVHADYMTDGRSGREQQVSDGVKIFSDRSAVTLILKIAEQRTEHPLTSIAVDFQIDGAGDWKPIKHFTEDELASMDLDAGSELTVNWDRTEDFADLLDMRGQAMVRVIVINKLDAKNDPSIATFEIVPPALRLGGLSINTDGATAQLAALQAELGSMDLNALVFGANAELGAEMIPPSLLPAALSIVPMLAGLQLLPAGFEMTDEQLDKENFGNGLTPKPTWYPLAWPDQREAGRWINGHQLQAVYLRRSDSGECYLYAQRFTGCGQG